MKETRRTQECNEKIWDGERFLLLAMRLCGVYQCMNECAMLSYRLHREDREKGIYD